MLFKVKLYQSYNCIKRLQKQLFRTFWSCYASMVLQNNWKVLSRVETQNIDYSMIGKQCTDLRNCQFSE